MIRFNKNTGACEMVHELKRDQIVMADNVICHAGPKTCSGDRRPVDDSLAEGIAYCRC